MNRRSLLLACAALAVTGLPAVAIPHAPGIIRRRLGPDTRAIIYGQKELRKMRGTLALRAKGNGLWIASMSWTDASGTIRTLPMRRNLPKGAVLPLPAMTAPTAISFEVTALPLSNSNTVIELAGGVPFHLSRRDHLRSVLS